MPSYVDGFLLPVPKKNLKVYRSLAVKAGRIWKKHGAVAFRECVGDDLKVPMGTPYARLLKLKAGEAVFYSFIIYRSRAHRDAVNRKVMKDPAMQRMMAATRCPFDVKRMSFGGFRALVDL